MHHLRRMWARIALLLVASLVASQALVAAQVCWPTAHASHSSGSALAPDDSSHHENTGRCPSAWLASDESVSNDPGLPVPGTVPEVHVFSPLAFAVAPGRPADSVSRMLGLSPPIPILFGNLRL